MNKIKAVVIDDMPLARATLKADISDYCPDVEVIGEADGVLSGIKVLKKLKPELLFLDIHLTDGEGFDILDILDDLSAKVIFTTASNEHAIQAFEVEALDYLLKPVDPDRLITAVNKLKSSRNQTDKLPNPERPGRTEKLSLHTQDDIKLVAIDQIIRLQSDGNYTTIYEANGEKTLVSKSIKEYEKILGDKGFIRTHQSHLVALDKIKSYLKSEGGFLQLIDGSEVPVSVRKKSQIMKILDKMSL